MTREKTDRKASDTTCVGEPAVKSLLVSAALITGSFLLAALAHFFAGNPLLFNGLLASGLLVNIAGVYSFAHIVREPNSATQMFFITPVVIVTLGYALMSWSFLTAPYVLAGVCIYGLAVALRKNRAD